MEGETEGASDGGTTRLAYVNEANSLVRRDRLFDLSKGMLFERPMGEFAVDPDGFVGGRRMPWGRW